MSSNKVVEIKFDLNGSLEKTAKILSSINEQFRIEVQEEIKEIKKETKSRVVKQLKKGHGINKGTYKKSIVINNLARRDPDKIAFQVGSKKHYRLTHLLEDGHDKWVFRRGKGRPTYRGNVGMVQLSGKTKAIKHIEPGQDYADRAVQKMYEEAWENAVKKEGNQ